MLDFQKVPLGRYFLSVWNISQRLPFKIQKTQLMYWTNVHYITNIRFTLFGKSISVNRIKAHGTGSIINFISQQHGFFGFPRPINWTSSIYFTTFFVWIFCIQVSWFFWFFEDYFDTIDYGSLIYVLDRTSFFYCSTHL